MNRPAPVEVSYKSMRFLITHNPTDASLSTFIQVSGPRCRLAAQEPVGAGLGAVPPRAARRGGIVTLVLGPRSGEPGVFLGSSV